MSFQYSVGPWNIHDDDVVPNIEATNHRKILAATREMRSFLGGLGSKAEFVTPRRWAPSEFRTGALTNPDAAVRRNAIDRSRLCLELTREIGCGLVESAHAIPAGLDPALEMAFAPAHRRLFGVHLNDRNSLRIVRIMERKVQEYDDARAAAGDPDIEQEELLVLETSLGATGESAVRACS